ncbi:LLM class flavin-dependent oxidoreductase [Aeromicrobium panaciterrae]
MQVGMTLPIMEPDLGPDTLEEWSQAIDAGPFSSLCFGERMAFDNPETLTLLGAVAAWTDRVRIVTTVIVPQLHEPVMLAKALATGDRLSKGRLTAGFGVGGRDEDYRAVGAELSTRTMAGMAERVAVMKRVWAGEKVTEAVRPVGPRPVQPGGPELLVGSTGPRTIRSAAVWADGLAGFELDLDLARAETLFDVARTAWREAGRTAPRLTTSFWVALDDGVGGARDQMHRHLRHYMNWLPADLVDALAPTAGFAGTEDELLAVLKQLEEIGADEVHLVPTTSDISMVERIAAAIS